MNNNNFNQLILCDHLRFQNPRENTDAFMKHSHNYYEVLYIESCDATYVIENREYQLKKDDLVFIRPLMYHYIEFKSNAEYKRYNIAFYPDFVNSETLKSIPEDLEVVHCHPNEIIAENFQRLDYYKSRFDQQSYKMIISNLLEEILLNLQFTKNDVLGTPSSLSPILEKALDYINEHLFTLKRIEEISEALFITESYFFKLFKDQLKISPKKYINTKRILHAQQLILRGEKPTIVYQKCGFESYVGFYKMYVKAFGCPPSQNKSPSIEQ